MASSSNQPPQPPPGGAGAVTTGGSKLARPAVEFNISESRNERSRSNADDNPIISRSLSVPRTRTRSNSKVRGGSSARIKPRSKPTLPNIEVAPSTKRGRSSDDEVRAKRTLPITDIVKPIKNSKPTKPIPIDIDVEPAQKRIGKYDLVGNNPKKKAMKAGEEVFNPPPTVSIKAASPQPKSASPQPKAKSKSTASSSSGPAETETQAQAQPQAKPANLDTKLAPSRIPDGLLVRILEEADKE